MHSLPATYELICEAFDAEPGMLCCECAGTGPGEKLFTYSTQRGAKVRQHDGIFCSRECHDRWHRLLPRDLS